MKIKLWGVRGSLATPIQPAELEEKLVASVAHLLRAGLHSENEIRAHIARQPVYLHRTYGGNTTCVEVSGSKQQLIIDAGTGLRGLGLNCGAQTEFHIFFTHFHWDHLMGLGFFDPMFNSKATIHFYAVQEDLQEVIRAIFKKPFFPVAYEKLPANLIYHRLQPRKPHQLGELKVTPYELDHPDPCWGYKIENQGKTFSFCVDTECTRVSAAQLGPDLPLYQNIDVMVIDAQYTLSEAVHRTSWGHTAATIGLDLAMREGIKRVYFVHYDPNSTDEMIAKAEQMTREYYHVQLKVAQKAGYKLFEVDWRFGQEGDEILL